jgi:2-methylcitrate dehydratase PrpD
MSSIGYDLAEWAHSYKPTASDLELADRALLDTVAVTLAARGDSVVQLASGLTDAARWAAVGHVLDFDDLHMESTTHISVVCVPATLASGGDARAYLAGAGVMARLGVALGWGHYAKGWHITCTSGAPAAAAAASMAMGLSVERTAAAMALAIPAAGGVQRAFGSSAKSLQVGFAADAGLRAARLAAQGATADPQALDDWLSLVGGDPSRIDTGGPAVPGGLAIKIFPCCYALQRPIGAIREGLPKDIAASEIRAIRVSTPAGTVQPLIHHRPQTGLQGKFSLEYSIAAAVLDHDPGFESFTDAAVQRAAAQRLVELVEIELTPGGEWLLAGQVRVAVELANGARHEASLELPPGSPGRPPTHEEFKLKIAECGDDVPDLLAGLDWQRAAALLNDALPSLLLPAGRPS